MTPEEVAEAYNVLAEQAVDYANANIERAGQAQASYGPLADQARGQSRTANIGNYTYNRIARPTVNSLRDDMVVQGLTAALNKQLSDSLKKAKNNYSNAGGGGGTGDPDYDDSGLVTIDGSDDNSTGSGKTGNGGTKPLATGYNWIFPDGHKEHHYWDPSAVSADFWIKHLAWASSQDTLDAHGAVGFEETYDEIGGGQ